MKSNPSWDKSWTLFLDRDGVINKLIPGDYVRNPGQLEILPGVPEAIAQFNQRFGRVFVVTNQRGISRNLMTIQDLEAVHQKLTKEIGDKGGVLDRIYFCPHGREEACDCRKPGTGMPLQAQKDFPEIDFSKSVLVGDSESDLQMGRKLGMTTFWVGEGGLTDPSLADYVVKSLPEMLDLQNRIESVPKYQEPALNADYWESRYQVGDHPWDLGCPAPALTRFLETLSDKKTKILLPGAGTAYEALWLFERGFENVFVLDWSAAALDRFRALAPRFPGSHLICEDFFKVTDRFDLVVEQTFFCALPPRMRGDYARHMAQILRQGGTLAGVLFDFPLTEKGPPFGGSFSEYVQLFSPYFEINQLEPCPDSIGGREGRELAFVFTRK